MTEAFNSVHLPVGSSTPWQSQGPSWRPVATPWPASLGHTSTSSALFRRLSDSYRQPFALPLQTLVPVKKNRELTLGKEITETRKRDPWGGASESRLYGYFSDFPMGVWTTTAFWLPAWICLSAVPLPPPPLPLLFLSLSPRPSLSPGSDSSLSWLRA